MTNAIQPTHVIDIVCPNGCGAVIHVPAVETGCEERTFGKDRVMLKTVSAPTLQSQINHHIAADCLGLFAAG